MLSTHRIRTVLRCLNVLSWAGSTSALHLLRHVQLNERLVFELTKCPQPANNDPKVAAAAKSESSTAQGQPLTAFAALNCMTNELCATLAASIRTL